MAEAVFTDLVAKAGLSGQIQVDSAGTGGWHIGESPHRGTRRVLADHGIACTSVARQVNRRDFQKADYLIAMDNSNAEDVRAMARGNLLNGRLHLLLDFAASFEEKDVPDPYYTGNFEEVYRMVDDGCRGLLALIRQEQGL
jgi:protein-tyrosine phosphatase